MIKFPELMVVVKSYYHINELLPYLLKRLILLLNKMYAVPKSRLGLKLSGKEEKEYMHYLYGHDLMFTLPSTILEEVK